MEVMNMRLERILQAAVNSMIRGHHTPHCYRAHVVGKGYVNDGSVQHDRADYLLQLERTATSEVENLGYASAYAEPGYDQPSKGIVFANWNPLPRGLDTILEKAGYAVEWSDEWTTCEDCQRAIRTSPDSYSWSSSYHCDDNGTILCMDCLADNPSDYLETLSGNTSACLTESLARQIGLTDHGYRLFNDTEYENGWHPGQNDDPKAIAEQLKAQGYTDFIFVQTEQSQFYIKFAVYVREDNDNGQ